MNRILFEPSELAADGRATFGGVRAEHVRTILHGEVGQMLKTGVVDGPIGTGVIERIDGESVTVRCVHDRAALPPWIDLVLAPPRPRVMKRLLPQLAAMGVGRIVLVGAAKVEKAFWGAQLLKEEVYRPLLVDGLMQAGTTALPTIQLERGFGGTVRRAARSDRSPSRPASHEPRATNHEPPCPRHRAGGRMDGRRGGAAGGARLPADVPRAAHPAHRHGDDRAPRAADASRRALPL